MVADTQNEHINSILQKHKFTQIRPNEWNFVGTVYTKMALTFRTMEFHHVDLCSSITINISDQIIIMKNNSVVFVTDSLDDLDSYLNNTLYLGPLYYYPRARQGVV